MFQLDDQMDGEHLISTPHNERQDSHVEGEHMPHNVDVEGEQLPNHADVEGEHRTSKPLVEGEPCESNHDDGNVLNNDLHDVTNNISIAGEVSDADDIFEDAPLDFDPAYPPMDKWTRDHPKEHILGDPNLVS